MSAPPTSAPPDVRSPRQARLAGLRRSLDRLERPVFAGAGPAARPGWRLGDAALDGTLPAGALPHGRLHEVTPASHDDSAAATGFLAGLVARLRDAPGPRPVLWCARTVDNGEFGRLYAPGLAAFGLAPGDLLLAEFRRDEDVLWALEEGLKSGALGVAVGELSDLDLTASRRLDLAAQASGCTPLVLRLGRRPGASAAWTRWQVAAAASGPETHDPRAPGAWRWQVGLQRIRAGGRPRSWLLEWQHETHRFALASRLADRAPAPRPRAALPVAGLVEPAARRLGA